MQCVNVLLSMTVNIFSGEKMNKIIALKLVNNEDIIGQVVNEPYVLEGVAIIIPGQKQTGEVVFQLFNWPMAAPMKKENVITIRPDAVICDYEPDEAIANQYKQIFGAGIVVPDKKILLN